MSGEFRILAAIDLGTGTDRLLAEVQRYGSAFNAVVEVLHVADPDPEFVGYLKTVDPAAESSLDNQRAPRASALRSEHHLTQTLGEMLRANGVRVDKALTVQGPILETILEHVRKQRPDLLILGSHHHGMLHRLWFGDTVAEAAKSVPCALLVVPL